MKKKILMSTLLAACVAFSVAPSQQVFAKESATIKGVVETTVESPFSFAGWTLGKTSRIVGNSINAPLKAAGVVVAAPGKIGNRTLDAIGMAVEVPGNIAKEILFALGDNISEAVTMPIDASRQIVTSPKINNEDVPEVLR